MPAANAVIKGNLTAKDFDTLKGISSATDNTLQSLSIAQGELKLSSDVNGTGTVVEQQSSVSLSNEPAPEDSPPVFDPAIYEYKVTVPFSGYPLVVNAVPTSSEAKVDIFCPAADEGDYGSQDHIVTITVTPQILVLYPDQADADPSITTKTYTINVTRKEANEDASVSSFSLLEAFCKDTVLPTNGSLGLDVTINVDMLHISAGTTDQNAVVKISDQSISDNDYTDAANSASAAIKFPIGNVGEEKTINIKVWAENRSQNTPYKVVVKRVSSGNPNATGGNLLISKLGGGETGPTYEIHTFLADDITASGGQKAGSLTFSKRPDTVDVLVVAGGGGGGGGNSGSKYHRAGGGGAGGYIYVEKYPIDADDITVKVGAGGHPPTGISVAGNGGNSIFGGIIAIGGGGGASHASGQPFSGKNGGSGGGASGGNYYGGAKSEGTVYPEPEADDAVKLKLGKNGGDGGFGFSGGGGGGANGPGGTPTAEKTGAMGGAGTQSAISGTLKWYAGGGAGGADVTVPNGANPPREAYGATAGNNGDPNTGDGGSGAGGVDNMLSGGKGGSGIVIVRWTYIE